MGFSKEYVAQCSSLKIIQYNRFVQTPLMWACMFTHKDVAEFLLTNVPECIHSYDCYGRTALIYALCCGNTEIASLLLNAYEIQNTDISLHDKRSNSINKFDREGNNALCYAAARGDMPLVTQFLRAGAYPTAKAIKLAAEHGHKELVVNFSFNE